MPLYGNTDLVRIDLPAEGEYVMAKRKLSRGDRLQVQQAALVGSRLTTATDLSLDAPEVLAAAEFAMLDIAIKVMCVSVRDGLPPESMDATPPLIRQLDDDSIDCIKERFEEMYPAPRSDDDRKNLSVNGARTRKAKAALPAS